MPRPPSAMRARAARHRPAPRPDRATKQRPARTRMQQLCGIACFEPRLLNPPAMDPVDLAAAILSAPRFRRQRDQMPRYDFRSPRLHLDVALAAGGTVALDPAQVNYLVNVLRLKAGDAVLVFNGRDGEWRGELTGAGKRKLALAIGARTREQTVALDLHYLFAPLKHARLDYMAQKAVEMGAS